MSDILQTSYDEQLQEKAERLSALLSSTYTNELDIFASPASHFRMRAEFRIWHDGPDSFHIMFDQATKEKYRVDSLPAAHLNINKAMQVMVEQLTGNDILRRKLYQIDYLCSSANDLLISMIYHKDLDDEWAKEISGLKAKFAWLANIDFIGRSKKQKLVLDRDYVTEKLVIDGCEYRFKQVENSFTQPNAFVNVHMIEWSMKQCKNTSGDLLELYCGAGNFSVPMTSCFNQVVGTEISKSSVSAAQTNIKDNNIDNLTIVRLSSEEFVEAMQKKRVFNRLKGIDLEQYDFSTVLVDPPRAGLDDATIEMISKYDNIIYISCNPETLQDNLTTLAKTHWVERAALFDQFPFTQHIESGVVLRKR